MLKERQAIEGLADDLVKQDELWLAWAVLDYYRFCDLQVEKFRSRTGRSVQITHDEKYLSAWRALRSGTDFERIGKATLNP